MGVRVVRRRDLVERGVETLKDAEKALSVGDYRDAEIGVEIARSYAKLAEALGESTLSERTGVGGNW